MSYNSVANNTGLSSFVLPLLAPTSAKFREIRIIAVQRHPRSSNLVSVGSAYATSYLSLIVTLIVTLVIEFLDETYHAKTMDSDLAWVNGKSGR